MAILHQAKRNLLTGYLHFFVFTSIFVLLTPFYINRLGDLIYGYWSVLNSVMAYLATLDFGLGIASTKFTAETLAKNDKLARSRILSQILSLYFLIGLILIAAGSSLSFFLPSFFRLPTNIWHSAALATFLMTLNLVFTLLSKFFAGVSFGHQRQEVPNIIAVGSALLQGGFSYWFLVNGFGIAGLASAVIIGGFFGLILRALYCALKFGPLGLSLRFLTDAAWGPLLRFGGGVFIMAIGGQVILNTDNILIGKVLHLRLVTAYSVAYMLIMAVGNIFQRISDVFFPVLTDNYTRSDCESLRFYFMESTFISMAGYTAAAVGLACFGADIISFWVGHEQFIGNKTLWVLLLFFWFQTFMHSHGLLLMSAGKIRPIVQLNIAEAITNLFLSVLLIMYLGVLGVALGSLLSIFITNYIFLPRYSSKILNVPRFQFNLKLTVSVLLPAVPVLAGGFLLRKYLPSSGFFQIFGSAALVSIAYLFSIWLTIGPVKRSWYHKKFVSLFFNKNLSGDHRSTYKKMDCSGNL
jgi:O-antigen/teichoic acid export membrane protein